MIFRRLVVLGATLMLLGGCGLLEQYKRDQAWEEAQLENTQQAYVTFLKEYGSGEHLGAIRAALFARDVDAALKKHAAEFPEERLAQFRNSAHPPDDASDQELQAMLLTLADIAPGWPPEIRQTIADIRPEPAEDIQGRLLTQTGEMLVRGYSHQIDHLAHMTVSGRTAEEKGKTISLYVAKATLPMETTLLLIKKLDLRTIQIEADFVLPVASGSILRFEGEVANFIDGWTFTSAKEDQPLTFVWLEDGLTYLSGEGTATGPDDQRYQFSGFTGPIERVE